MCTFSYFQFIPNCQKLWHLKNQFFLLLHKAVISLALPLSLLPFTSDTHIICLQWNVSQCVQIWIFNVSNTDSVTQTIYLWYKYYLKWICVSFSFQYRWWSWSWMTPVNQRWWHLVAGSSRWQCRQGRTVERVLVALDMAEWLNETLRVSSSCCSCWLKWSAWQVD